MRTRCLGGNTRMTVRNAEDARRGRTQRDSSTLSLYPPGSQPLDWVLRSGVHAVVYGNRGR